MTNLSPGTVTTVGFTGAAVTYTVTAPGTITFKVWGAAGGQSSNSSTSGRNVGQSGGAGGYTTLSVRVVTGDVIKLEVAQGGRGSVQGAAPTRGVGGYPDGGDSAVGTNNTIIVGYGGGGGSTRVYLNNTLIAVAGGGGGGGGGSTSGTSGGNGITPISLGGAGGGANGRSTPTQNSNLGATGGSQTAGGVNNNSANAQFAGASLQGGKGYPSTNTTPTVNVTTANSAGPGGGGGYFGGGGCAASGSNSANASQGGGGGSGYVNTAHAAVLGGNTFQGYEFLPYGSQDADYPGGTIGVPAHGTTSGAGLNDGGDGAVVMRFASQVTLPNGTKQTVAYTGGAVDYICNAAGNIAVKAWGAAGGGSLRNTGSSGAPVASAGGHTGSGGFATFKFDVAANDIITVEVGRGGRGASLSGTVNTLGEGGWPDGGRGAFDITTTGATQGTAYGGGGGSTRIYRNGVLIGVAAAGAGANTGTATGAAALSGSGGGTSGTTADTVGTALGGTGATQAAGGAYGGNTGDTGFQGAHLFGGEGSSSTVFNPMVSNGSGKSGPGGGGGYYGGGGAAAANATNGAAGGGGGSSWWDPTLPNLVDTATSAGSDTTPGGNTDTDYALVTPAGAGAANPTGGSGNNGGAVLLLTSGYPLPGPVTVSNLITAGVTTGTPTGAVGTITMTAPDSGENTGPAAAGDPGTVTMTAPGGSAGSEDPLPVITIENLLSGQPVTEADITAVVSENDIIMSLNDPAGSVSGAIDITVPFPADPIGGPVAMTAPEATPTAGEDITGLIIGTVTMTAPTGLGENGVSVDGPLPVGAVTMTAPVAVASTGFATLLTPLIITLSRPLATGAGLIGTLAFSNSITLTPPTASVEIGPTATAADLPVVITMTPPTATESAPAIFSVLNSGPLTIQMNVPNGTPQSGSPVFSTSAFPNSIVLTPVDAFAEPGIAAEADLTGLITLTSPTGSARGDQNAIVDFGPSILMSPVFGIGEAGLLVDNSTPIVIAMDPPTGTAFHAVTLAVTILPAKISMVAPQAAAFAGTFVLAIGDLDPLVITMTEPNAFTSAITEASDAILMDYVDGYVDVPLPGGVSKIKLKRSTTEKIKPTVLAPREIALNEADGVLYSRDGAGAILGTPYLGFGKGRLRPAGGADGEVLGVDFTWKSPPTAGGAPAQITPPAATRVLLANNFLGLNADRPLQTVADGQFPVHYRPFFLPRATHITAISVYQETGNFSSDPSVGVGGRIPLRVWLGVCEWNPNLEAPGATVVQGHIDDASGIGNQLRELAVDTILPVGWYAAMLGAHNITYLATQGSTLATFRAWRGGLTVGPNFVPQGEPYGLQPIGSDLTSAPAVAAYATVADGDVPDHAFVQATTA